MNIVFNGSERPTLGVELEVQIVDESGALATDTAATKILSELNGAPGYKHELLECTMEMNTGVCTTVTRWAVLENDSKPVLGFTGMPLEALGRQFAASFGPGLGVSGAEVETGFGIPSYVSLGVGRSAGLVYSTRQSYPRALVTVDLELTWPAGTPDQIKLDLWDGAAKLDSLVLASPTCATGAARRCRAAMEHVFHG